MFRSSILRLMPPQLYERVDKWTHEPRSNFNHKKHLSNVFTHTFIFSIILFRKYKNIFTFLHTHTKPKNTFPASYLLYCICYLLYLHCHHIYFTYIHTLCLTTTRWSWGHKTRKLFCRLLEEERRELARLFPESLILNPQFPRGETLLSVINMIIKTHCIVCH
jgi:hypothetical protein